ncbi:MAG: hypothetical protein HXO24_06205 [Prevotella sp.]|nr:hypothetical protein [Prevotella sp.]
MFESCLRNLKTGSVVLSTFPVFVIPYFPHIQDIFCPAELEKTITQWVL